jgi:hypothetical protein
LLMVVLFVLGKLLLTRWHTGKRIFPGFSLSLFFWKRINRILLVSCCYFSYIITTNVLHIHQDLFFSCHLPVVCLT